MKSIVISFGRMNPPTNGHERIVRRMKYLAEELECEHRLIVTQTTKPVGKNPLSVFSKLKHLKRAFPNIHIVAEKTLFDVFDRLQEDRYDAVYIVAGEDRADTYRALVNSYEGELFTFLALVSTVSRGQDEISSTLMRKWALAKDFACFRDGLPTRLKNNRDWALELYEEVGEALVNKKIRRPD